RAAPEWHRGNPASARPPFTHCRGCVPLDGRLESGVGAKSCTLCRSGIRLRPARGGPMNRLRFALALMIDSAGLAGGLAQKPPAKPTPKPPAGAAQKAPAGPVLVFETAKGAFEIE